MKNYGTTGDERVVLESAKCREIISEILDFGVSQSQIEVLIKLLAMELENRSKMLAIKECIDSFNDKKLDNNKIVT